MSFFKKILGDHFSIDNDDIDSKYRLSDDDDYNPFLEKHRRTDASLKENNHIIKDDSSIKDIDTLNPEKHHHEPLKKPVTNVTTTPVWESDIKSPPETDSVIEESSSFVQETKDFTNDEPIQKASKHKNRVEKIGLILGISALVFILSIFQVAMKNREKNRIASHTIPDIVFTTQETLDCSELKHRVVLKNNLRLSRRMLSIQFIGVNGYDATASEEIEEIIDECIEDGTINFYDNALYSLINYIGVDNSEEYIREHLEELGFTSEEIDYAIEHMNDTETEESN